MNAAEKAEIYLIINALAVLVDDPLAEQIGGHQSYCHSVRGNGECDCEGYGEFIATTPVEEVG